MSSYIILLDTLFLMKYWEAQNYTLDDSNWWFEIALRTSTYKGTLNMIMAHHLFKIRSLQTWENTYFGRFSVTERAAR